MSASFVTSDGRTLVGIPDAQCVVLVEAGHLAWFDAPDEFRKEIRGFLEE